MAHQLGRGRKRLLISAAVFFGVASLVGVGALISDSLAGGGDGWTTVTNVRQVNTVLSHDGVAVPAGAAAVTLKSGPSFRHPEYLAFSVPAKDVETFLAANELCNSLSAGEGVRGELAHEGGWDLPYSAPDIAGCAGSLVKSAPNDGRSFELSVDSRSVGDPMIYIYMVDT